MQLETGGPRRMLIGLATAARLARYIWKTVVTTRAGWPRLLASL